MYSNPSYDFKFVAAGLQSAALPALPWLIRRSGAEGLSGDYLQDHPASPELVHGSFAHPLDVTREVGLGGQLGDRTNQIPGIDASLAATCADPPEVFDAIGPDHDVCVVDATVDLDADQHLAPAGRIEHLLKSGFEVVVTD